MLYYVINRFHLLKVSQMVRFTDLESSFRLTVQKLRYKRKKQERLAEKIARRLEKMMDTQTSEREVSRFTTVKLNRLKPRKYDFQHIILLCSLNTLVLL